MSESAIANTALLFLPRLEMFYLARRQARWQQKAAAGENKLAWQAALILLDNKIAIQEQAVKCALGLDAYRGKRVFTE